MSLGIGVGLQRAIQSVERDRTCKERNSGEHVWGAWGKWILNHYKKYPSKPRTGGAYYRRVRVCKDCRARNVAIFHPSTGKEQPTEGEFE